MIYSATSEITRIIIDPQGNSTVLDLWHPMHSLTSPPHQTNSTMLKVASPPDEGSSPSQTKVGSKTIISSTPRQTKVGSETVTHSNHRPFSITQLGLHYGEEEFIVANGPTIAVYFAKCNLRCRHCTMQTEAKLQLGAEALLEYVDKAVQSGGQSLSLVSPTLYWRPLLPFLQALKLRHPELPVIYNCGGYETADSIAALSPYIDIYLPDFKAVRRSTLMQCRLPEDYANRCLKHIVAMLRRKPLRWQGHRLLQGVAVRHLLLPEHENEAEAVLSLLQPYRRQLLVNLMTHYYLPLERRVRHLQLSAKARALLQHFMGYQDGFKSMQLV